MINRTGMRKISICDISLRKSGDFYGNHLPFKIKIEVAKQLSQLGASYIETAALGVEKTDYYLVKSLASTISKGTISVPIDILDPDSPAKTWDALKYAVSGRLVVNVPVSTVQMEYFCHMKPDAILNLIRERVSACYALCNNVEFVAGDFARSDENFLKAAINTALESGAKTITIGDAAGNLLPEQFALAVANIKNALPEDIRLGVFCSNEFFLADACAVAAVKAGADEIKTMAFGNRTVSLERFPKILQVHSENLNVSCDISLTNLQQGITRINKLCEFGGNKISGMAGGFSEGEGEIRLSAQDNRDTVLSAVKMLGYDLSDEDSNKVFDAFIIFANGRSSVEGKELDAIVASVAFQVPPTYILESFVINNGNTITATCHLRLRKDGDLLESVCIGDGPVDAAFIAIDQAVGKHYELDDFQIKSVTEGREALGEAVVRLRFEGNVYSGRGVSKDIVESSVKAYLNAINKISYGEELN